MTLFVRLKHSAWHARRRADVSGGRRRFPPGSALVSPPRDAMGKTELTKTEKKYNKKDVFALKEIFDDADVDRSGEIDAAELRKALNRSNLGDAADDFFKAIDKDGSKKIGFDEYLRVRAAERGVPVTPRFSIDEKGCLFTATRRAREIFFHAKRKTDDERSTAASRARRTTAKPLRRRSAT